MLALGSGAAAPAPTRPLPAGLPGRCWPAPVPDTAEYVPEGVGGVLVPRVSSGPGAWPLAPNDDGRVVSGLLRIWMEAVFVVRGDSFLTVYIESECLFCCCW